MLPGLNRAIHIWKTIADNMPSPILEIYQFLELLLFDFDYFSMLNLYSALYFSCLTMNIHEYQISRETDISIINGEPLQGNIHNMEIVHSSGQEIYGKSLHHMLSFAMNIELLFNYSLYQTRTRTHTHIHKHMPRLY